MPKRRTQNVGASIAAIDLFCGAGGLTRGLLDAGINVVAGYDIDARCKFPYEYNNQPACFINESVTNLRGVGLASHYKGSQVKVLVGCAPCVTFSKYTQGQDHQDNPKWSLLRDFARLVRELKPDIVSMENVPDLQRHSVFDDFIQTLTDERFHVPTIHKEQIVYCPDYGIPQHRTRLVILASRFGPLRMCRRTHPPSRYRTVHDAIRKLPKLAAGECSENDLLHRSSALSPLNFRRIRYSKPGGSWRDWPASLRADCHRSKTGKSYPGVYGRMQWHEPAPTITTQFFGFGNGRFGHPSQDRGLSLREGALLQSFPETYAFVPQSGEYQMKAIGRMIGNAVPVRLAQVIGRSIQSHVRNYV
jgi:Site-specific DNA methylase